jgi:ribosomal protein L12E/L44/L45/RPP1/RPP2
LDVSMENRKITVYVKSVKTERIEKIRVASRGSRAMAAAAPGGYPAAGVQVSKDYRHAYLGEEEKEVVIDEYTLPPDQKKLVDLVKNVAKQYEYAVEIVDMAKENIVEKLIEEIKGLDTIPTVKTSLGGRLEGSQITKENVELLLLNETRQRPIG